MLFIYFSFQIKSQFITHVIHFDFYRTPKASVHFLQEFHEAHDRGDGLVVVEWAQHIAQALPKARIDIHLEILDGDRRKIIITHQKS